MPPRASFSGTPTAVGTFSVIVTASDHHLAGQASFQWAVASPLPGWGNAHGPDRHDPIDDARVRMGGGLQCGYCLLWVDDVAQRAWWIMGPRPHRRAAPRRVHAAPCSRRQLRPAWCGGKSSRGIPTDGARGPRRSPQSSTSSMPPSPRQRPAGRLGDLPHGRRPTHRSGSATRRGINFRSPTCWGSRASSAVKHRPKPAQRRRAA